MGSSRQVLRRPHASTTLLAVALMVATGVRVHEVVSILCQDIDLSGRSLRLLGKGRRERHVFLTNDWITDLTAAFLEARATLGLQHQHLLFNSRHDPLTAAAMRSRLAKAAADAGLSTKVTPHMLRHTAATQLIEAGVDIRYIQRSSRARQSLYHRDLHARLRWGAQPGRHRGRRARDARKAAITRN